MLRRPKVQFKPKIGGKEGDRKKAPAVKPRSTSTSSVTSSSHVLAANERDVVLVTPVTNTTIVEVPPSDDETEAQSKSEEQIQEVVEEQVVEYENLHPVQFESQEYNCLVEDTAGNRSFDSENISLSQDFDRQEQIPTETVTTPTLPPSPSKGSRITLKPKETPAALTVSSQDTSGKRKNPVSGNTASSRKPRICLSSSRVKLPTDRQVTMFDLLSYNPPMTEEQKERKKKAEEECAMSSRKSIDEPSPASKDKAPSEKTTKKSGPRVKMGADGSIIVDEESLILKSNMADAVGETVYDEAENGANYASFRTKGSKFRWSNEETVKFYRALSAVGPDFTLMSQLFFSGSRTRLDLRNKFKKEEKQNPQLIDRALTNNDLSLLKEVLEKRKEEQTVESNQETREDIVPEAENPLLDQDEDVNDGDDAVIIKEAQLQEKSMSDERSGNKIRGKKRKKTASQDKEFKGKKKATLVSEPVRKSNRIVKPNVRLSS